MEYKDCLGAEINVGDNIVYSSFDGLQIGRVLELTVIKDYEYVWDPKLKDYKRDAKGKHVKKVSRMRPSLKIQGARRAYDSRDKFEKMKPSVISKFENILVLTNNLVAQMTLI